MREFRRRQKALAPVPSNPLTYLCIHIGMHTHTYIYIYVYICMYTRQLFLGSHLLQSLPTTQAPTIQVAGLPGSVAACNQTAANYRAHVLGSLVDDLMVLQGCKGRTLQHLAFVFRGAQIHRSKSYSCTLGPRISIVFILRAPKVAKGGRMEGGGEEP